MSILKDDLSCVSNLTGITKDEISNIMHCRKHFLFHNGEVWVKKENCDFYIGMAGLNSVEVCELVGLFLLNQMEDVILQELLGLDQDDGLGTTDLSSPELDRLIRKEITRVFQRKSLRVTVETGRIVTDFLNITLNLS